MPVCANCGTNNVEGVRFCSTCGTQIGEAPPPESWRASSDLGPTPRPPADPDAPNAAASDASAPGPSSYPPPPSGYPPPSNYPAHPQPSYGGTQYQQQPPAAQPMHPAVPAIVSLFLPGIGLLFVPNKAGLGIGIFAATIGYAVVATLLTFVVIGICLFVIMPIINVAAAIHSWDEAAKASGGQFQPILFK